MPSTYRDRMRSLESTYNTPADQHADSDSDVTMVDDREASASTLTGAPVQGQTTTALSPTSGGEADYLDLLSPEAREEYYKETFSLAVPIADIEAPFLTDDYKGLETEILRAYLRHTTFIFKIFINYDAAAQRFYADYPRQNSGRYGDCGKLLFSPHVSAHLQTVKAHKALLSNVRLDICTHLTPLAQVTLEVRPGPRIDHFINHVFHEDDTLTAFINHCARQIAHPSNDATRGKAGFNLSDVGKLSSLFRVEQNEYDRDQMLYNNYSGPWETEDENTGYVEGLNYFAHRPASFV